MSTPAYWQRQKARHLWPDHSYQDIATAVRVSRWTLQQWRDDGHLDPLPDRYVVPGQQRLRRDRKPPAPKPRKVTAAPLTVEPLCECQPCRLCKYENVCRERCRIGVWMACETPDARALEVAAARVAELT